MHKAERSDEPKIAASFTMKVFSMFRQNGALAHHSVWTLENLTRMNKQHDSADCSYGRRL